MKFYSTLLTFSDIQRPEFSKQPSTPAPDALIEFPDIDDVKDELLRNGMFRNRERDGLPISGSNADMADQPGERTYYARCLGYRPAPIEVIPKIPQHERGDLP